MLDANDNVQIILVDPCSFNAKVNNAMTRLYSVNVEPFSTPLETKYANMLVKSKNVNKPITLKYLQDFRLKALNEECFDDE